MHIDAMHDVVQILDVWGGGMMQHIIRDTRCRPRRRYRWTTYMVKFPGPGSDVVSHGFNLSSKNHEQDLVRPKGESSNSLFKALEKWNVYLERHATCFQVRSQAPEPWL